MAIRLREMSSEEQATIEQIARSKTEPARRVERFRILRLAHEGLNVPAISRKIGIGEKWVRTWLKRFNDRGLKGLDDEPRSGRPPTYSSEQVSEVVVTALTKPEDLGLPFACWTLDRLEAYLNEQKGISIKRSRIDEILLAEGLRWRQQETWFGEKVDPNFAEKRGDRTVVSGAPRREHCDLC